MRLIGLLLVVATCVVSAPARPTSSASARSAVAAVRFEANEGQLDPEVRYVARTPGASLYVTSTGLVAALVDPLSQKVSAVRMTLEGGNATRIAGAGPLPGRTTTIVGRDPSRWRSGIASVSSVRCSSVYEGVDLVYYGAGRDVECDFVVAPGADPSRIGMRFDGAESVAIDAAGALVVRSSTGELRHRAPTVYQIVGSDRRPVASHFSLLGDGLVGFALGAYEPSAPLVVDPVLSSSALVGGGNRDVAAHVAVSGTSVFVAGYTVSADFPTRGGVGPYASGIDVFVARFDDGSCVPTYATYVGGSFTDTGVGIAATGDGRVVVTGYTSSPDFPLASPIVDRSESFDAFVFELSASGGALDFSTYLGGSGDDFAYGVALDADSAVYVAGATSSADLPVRSALQSALSGPQDAFVAKLAPGGTAIEYMTYLGGTDVELAVGGVAVDDEGAAYVTGRTSSASFPLVHAIQGHSGEDDVFVAKLAPSGSSLVYSTLLGGDESDAGLAIAVGADCRAFVAGATGSVGFPSKAAIARHGEEPDAFVVALTPDGGSLDYVMAFRTDDGEVAQGIAVDGAGRAVVVGYCTSPEFPIVSPVQIPFGGTQDAFVARISADGARLEMSTKLGGRLQDAATSVALAPNGEAVVVGATASIDFPVAGDALTSLVADEDAFVSRIALDDGPAPPSVAKVKAAGSGRNFKVTVRGAGFVAGATVAIGDDTAPWTGATVTAKKIKLAGGDDLAARFPRGVPVRIRVVNPDGGIAFASLVR